MKSFKEFVSEDIIAVSDKTRDDGIPSEGKELIEFLELVAKNGFVHFTNSYAISDVIAAGETYDPSILTPAALYAWPVFDVKKKIRKAIESKIEQSKAKNSKLVSLSFTSVFRGFSDRKNVSIFTLKSGLTYLNPRRMTDEDKENLLEFVLREYGFTKSDFDIEDVLTVIAEMTSRLYKNSGFLNEEAKMLAAELYDIWKKRRKDDSIDKKDMDRFETLAYFFAGKIKDGINDIRGRGKSKSLDLESAAVWYCFRHSAMKGFGGNAEMRGNKILIGMGYDVISEFTNSTGSVLYPGEKSQIGLLSASDTIDKIAIMPNDFVVYANDYDAVLAAVKKL